MRHIVIGSVVGSDMIVDGTVLIAANMEPLSFTVSGENIVINGDASVMPVWWKPILLLSPVSTQLSSTPSILC
jgi:hypothetical protein